MLEINTRTGRLKLRAVWELLRYDLVFALRGFHGIRRGLGRRDSNRRPADGVETAIFEAVEWAAALYWKRVRCLQRSAAAARLLRAHGIPAELVIGCRLAPFVAHAWVEIEGRVLSGPSGYPQKLEILERA